MDTLNLNPGTRVIGTNYGVPFIGTVTQSRKPYWTNPKIDVHVEFDTPVTIHGTERTRGIVSVDRDGNDIVDIDTDSRGGKHETRYGNLVRVV